jgi:hypothetical protein
MKIQICDLCKTIPLLRPRLAKMIRFEAEDDIWGKPRKTIELCENCFEKIFWPIDN